MSSLIRFYATMAKTKSAGSTRLGRDSVSKRLGVKLFGGQIASPGSIIVRQHGTKFLPGTNVRKSGDDTLYSTKSGVVQFKTAKKIRFDGSKKLVKIVEVKPAKER